MLPALVFLVRAAATSGWLRIAARTTARRYQVARRCCSHSSRRLAFSRATAAHISASTLSRSSASVSVIAAVPQQGSAAPAAV